MRTNLKQGADFIKILGTGAVLSKGAPPGGAAVLRRRDARRRRGGRALGQARRRARCTAPTASRPAIRAGVHTVDHGSMMDDEAVAAAARRTTPTSCRRCTRANRSPRTPNVPESEKARSKQITAMKDASFQLVLKAGLPIGFATDAAVVPHGQNAREFGYRVRLGQSPMAAIVSATKTAAEIIGWSDRVGTIEAGKFADLIARGRRSAARHHRARARDVRDEGRRRH